MISDIKEIKYGKRTYLISESHLNQVDKDCISLGNTFDGFLDIFKTHFDLHFLLSQLQANKGYQSIVLSFLTMKENSELIRKINNNLFYGESYDA